VSTPAYKQPVTQATTVLGAPHQTEDSSSSSSATTGTSAPHTVPINSWAAKAKAAGNDPVQLTPAQIAKKQLDDQQAAKAATAADTAKLLAAHHKVPSEKPDLADDSISDHILPEHGFTQAPLGKGRFFQDPDEVQLKAMIRATAQHEHYQGLGNVQGRYEFERDVGKPIGHDSAGNPTRRLRVITSANKKQSGHDVVTAFPV
jgi:hypothetical protein